MRLFHDARERNEPFDLLLLDWKMPGMSGIDVARRIDEDMRQGTLKRPPTIVMVTAYGRDELIKALGGLPIASILAKPVTPSGLLDTLVQLGQGPARPDDATDNAFAETRTTLGKR